MWMTYLVCFQDLLHPREWEQRFTRLAGELRGLLGYPLLRHVSIYRDVFFVMGFYFMGDCVRNGQVILGLHLPVSLPVRPTRTTWSRTRVTRAGSGTTRYVTRCHSSSIGWFLGLVRPLSKFIDVINLSLRSPLRLGPRAYHTKRHL